MQDFVHQPYEGLSNYLYYYTILGVPYRNCGILYTKTLFKLLRPQSWMLQFAFQEPDLGPSPSSTLLSSSAVVSRIHMIHAAF